MTNPRRCGLCGGIYDVPRDTVTFSCPNCHTQQPPRIMDAVPSNGDYHVKDKEWFDACRISREEDDKDIEDIFGDGGREG